MKVAAYCRVSTELDDQQNSLKNQQEYFASFIQKKEENWKFAGILRRRGHFRNQCKKKRSFSADDGRRENGKDRI